MEFNRVQVSGRLMSLGDLHASPAGVEHRDIILEHRSLQSDQEGSREVRFSLRVRLAGHELNALLTGVQAGERLQVTGYLGRNNHRDEQVVLHARTIDRMNQEQ